MEQSLTCDWLRQLETQFEDVELFPPAPPEVIAEAEKEVGPLPKELADLLVCSNGLVTRSFRLFSAFDRSNVKKSWESLQRANSKANGLIKDPDLLARFLTFADIGNGVALLDRTDGTIWFTESHDDEIHQIDLTLPEFIQTMIENAE